MSRTKSPIAPETATNGRNGTEQPKSPPVGRIPDVRFIIPRLNIQSLEITIEGITPLIVRAWDQKIKQQLADKQAGKKSAKSRVSQIPEEVFNGARYRDKEEGWDGIPASAFKGAMCGAVSCCNISKSDFSMKAAKQCFFIKTQGIDASSGRELVRIYGEPEIFALMQPTSAGGPYMSYRPRYFPWRCILQIGYNACKIDGQGVINLLANAGQFVGVCEHRPSAPKSQTGTSGRWKIVEGEGGRMDLPPM